MKKENITEMIEIENLKSQIISYKENYNREQLLWIYWSNHPRFQFFKNQISDSKFLDIGAGNGNLHFWKEWGDDRGGVRRGDINLYGIDLSIGKYADKYEQFDALNLDTCELPYKSNYFDTLYAAHVIEHLEFKEEFIKKIEKVLKVSGKVYIECPSLESYSAPSLYSFEKNGIRCGTMNFFDDKSHVSTLGVNELEKLFIKNKSFKIIQSGFIINDYIEKILINYAFQFGDIELMTYALWLRYKWSNYIIVEKISILNE